MSLLLANRGGNNGSGITEGLLQRQDEIVANAKARIEKIAEVDDPVPNGDDDPSLEAKRNEALAQMMGIKSPPTGVEVPPGAPRDLSAARARRSTDMVEALRGCETLECVKVAHTRPRGNAEFNFPHFLIVGWQKTVRCSEAVSSV